MVADDVTGSIAWDSGLLLQRALLCHEAATALNVELPPTDVLELGAGTGSMACALAVRWPCLKRYWATDLPARVDEIDRAGCSAGISPDVLMVRPLTFGEAPPAPRPTATSLLVLLADVIYFAGKDVLEADTLEPLCETLSLTLSSHPNAACVMTYRERDVLREDVFRTMCANRGMLVCDPLGAAALEALLPRDEQRDVEASGPLRLCTICASPSTLVPCSISRDV